jgi:hypothetical protein
MLTIYTNVYTNPTGYFLLHKYSPAVPSDDIVPPQSSCKCCSAFAHNEQIGPVMDWGDGLCQLNSMD